MGKRVFIGVVAALTAVVGTGVANATPSPTWGPTACAVGGQTTAAWNKARLDHVTFAWYGVGSDPDNGGTPLDTKVMPVTTHPPKGSFAVPTTAGAVLVRVFFATDGDAFPPFVDQPCT
jgi:hypothetical protein